MRVVSTSGRGRNRRTRITIVRGAYPKEEFNARERQAYRKGLRKPRRAKQAGPPAPGGKPREGNPAKRGKREWWACWQDEATNIVVASAHYTEESAMNKAFTVKQEHPGTKRHQAIFAPGKVHAEALFALGIAEEQRKEIAQAIAPPTPGTEAARTHEHEPQDSTPPLGAPHQAVHFIDHEDGTPSEIDGQDDQEEDDEDE